MRNRFVKNKKKKILIILFTILLVILCTILAYLFFFKKEKEIVHDVIFTLIGEEEITLEVDSDYEEPGCNLTIDGSDYTKNIKIDDRLLSLSQLGEYKIKYYIILDGREYNYYRTIKVIDTTKPSITLNGSDKITILLKEDYKEQGYIAIDNYDNDITDKVAVESNLDNTKVGQYKITYTVSDSSGNSSSVVRIINVKKPNVIVTPNNSENKETIKEVNPTNYTNTVTKNNFTTSGIYIEGYKKSNNGSFKLKLEGDNEYYFDLTANGNNYKGNIDFTEVVNGSYNVYIESESSEKLLNKMDIIEKIVRAKVKDKLVTVQYNNKDEVTVKVEDFAYLYDILIDPGHGGSDTGASNEYIYEKEMNLTVSLYEKCRFEEHGFKVYMTRTNDNYGSGLGSDSLLRLQRRAYEIGYYGVTSKIVYSNHHNAIGNNTYSGYEVLLPGYLSANELENELKIVNKYNTIYPLKENHMRFYATDYVTEKKYSKLNGDIYNFKDNYAVNRIPYQLFNTKSIIYEGSYLTNKSDFNWYWNEKNWIKVSETKLEVYINYLGGNYNRDNSKCL